VKVIGLTGSIASGKSTVARILSRLGAEVIDADQIARDVVAPGSPLLDRLRESFGAGVITEEGTLDRKRLGEIVFADQGARKRLEGILHPEIRRVSRELMEDARRRGIPVLVYVAPLLIESGRIGDVDEVWVVDVSEERQLARLMGRDGCSAEEARQRMAAQMGSAEKKRFAARVIDNDGEPEETERIVTQLYREVLDSLRP
jgi:dephospho-CoA kinase